MTNTTRFSKAVSRSVFGIGLLAIAALFIATPSQASADTLYRQIDLGMTGSDVGSLQTFLAKDYSLYPEARITSYFGALTAAAVSRFQTRNGISPVGRVGPVTLAALNAQMSGMTTGGFDVYAPTISGLSVTSNSNSASVSWSTNEISRGTVYYSTSPLTASETLHTVNIGGNTAMTDTSLRSSQIVSLQSLLSNTTYYYMVHSVDAEGNVSVSWPLTFRTSN